MSDQANNEKKLIIDDDWKAQARAEKEKLAAAARSEKAEKPVGESTGEAPAASQESAGDGDSQRRPKLPDASITTIMSTMATQAMFAMGAAPDPRTGQHYLDLDMARFQIDCLAVLAEKTEGNLSEQEKTQLNNTIYELRSHFIAVARQVNSQSVAGQG